MSREAEFIRIQADAKADAQDRRARVLKHSDLAQMLTARPLSYAKPEQWNGYVPPKMVPDKDGYKLNTSPQRRALVEICVEAMRRENGGAPADAEDAADEIA